MREQQSPTRGEPAGCACPVSRIEETQVADQDGSTQMLRLPCALAKNARVHVYGLEIVLTGIFSSSNALQAFQTSLDTTANNLANVATNAFKSRRTLFQDVFYAGPLSDQIGVGSQVASIDRAFQQGKTTITGNEFDVAIQGQGFFALLSPNGTIQYTRDGSFRVDAAGRLMSSDGLLVQPPITLPANVISSTIAADGTVTVLTASSPNTPVVVGQLRLTNFINLQGLAAVGGNRFVETEASGLPLTNIPGTNGLGVLQQGSLEQSNVDTTTEMVKLVNTSRDYVANSRALKVEDQVVEGALDLVV